MPLPLYKDPSLVTERCALLCNYNTGMHHLAPGNVICVRSRPSTPPHCRTAVLINGVGQTPPYAPPPCTQLTLEEKQEPPWTAKFRQWHWYDDEDGDTVFFDRRDTVCALGSQTRSRRAASGCCAVMPTSCASSAMRSSASTRSGGTRRAKRKRKRPSLACAARARAARPVTGRAWLIWVRGTPHLGLGGWGLGDWGSRESERGKVDALLGGWPRAVPAPLAHPGFKKLKRPKKITCSPRWWHSFTMMACFAVCYMPPIPFALAN